MSSKGKRAGVASCASGRVRLSDECMGRVGLQAGDLVRMSVGHEGIVLEKVRHMRVITGGRCPR